MQETYWHKIEEIFSRAVALPKNDRQAFVEENCGGDDELCREILALLLEDEENSDFLSEPVFNAGLQILGADFTGLLKKEKFAHYKLLKQLGSGGTGIVFLAEDTQLRRRAALKIITPSLTSQPEVLKRFQQEARAASNISHPNVAHIYEFGQHDEYYFLAMEYTAGKTLREMLNENRVDLNLALEIGVQTAGALAAAHRNGIIHRDIKPENIVITDDGLAKVLDFGLAKISEENPPDDFRILDASLLETTPGMIIGTVAYMSPEQIRGQKLDARTDLWSLGVVLYEMLNGNRPFEGETRSDVLAAILKTEITPSEESVLENIREVE